MEYKVTNAYYFRYINKIGGIESHLYYLARKYSKVTDITVFYLAGDAKQIARLRKYAQVSKLETEDTVECENLFCCFNKEILDRCKAKNKYAVLHGDYKAMVENGHLMKSLLPIDPRIDKYLGVSKTVCEAWEEITGIKAEFVGEPIVLDRVKKPMLFVSATRLSKEKGWWRMKTLANALNRAKVPYLWLVYTDMPQEAPDNMVMLPPMLDITDRLGLFDAVIQLSDNEGFNLTCVEGLMRGVPFIGNDLPVYQDLGLTPENSILLDLNMMDIPIEAIANIHKKKFKYKEPADYWDRYLTLDPPKYIYDWITIEATNQWQVLGISDSQRRIIPKEGDTWDVSPERYKTITEYEKKQGVTLIKKGTKNDNRRTFKKEETPKQNHL